MCSRRIGPSGKRCGKSASRAARRAPHNEVIVEGMIRSVRGLLVSFGGWWSLEPLMLAARRADTG